MPTDRDIRAGLPGSPHTQWLDVPILGRSARALADRALVWGQIDLVESPLVPCGWKERATGVMIEEADGLYGWFRPKMGLVTTREPARRAR